MIRRTPVVVAWSAIAMFAIGCEPAPQQPGSNVPASVTPAASAPPANSTATETKASAPTTAPAINLNQQVSFEFDGVTLADFAQFFGQLHNISVSVDPAIRNRTVTLSKSGTLKDMLNEMLTPAHVKWKVVGNTLHFLPAEEHPSP